MKITPTHLWATRAAARALPLGLLTLPLAALPQTQDAGPKVPAPLPHFDVDGDKAPWVAPVKDGVHATDFARLSPADRASLEASVEQIRSQDRGPDRTAPGAGATQGKPALEPSTPTFAGAEDVRGHFQIDTPGDGRVWVFGGTYKASFGAEGATYIPALGSAAPRNFPVTFRMDTVTSGGEALGFEREVAPTLDGEAVVFHRGALRERYDVALGRVEQSFEFDSLPSEGALVVELDVESELVGQAAGDGLTFVGDLGRVDYSGAFAIDAAGRRLALETRLVDGEVHLVVPADFVATAALPLVIDPVITTWTVNNAGSDDFQADIAYDPTWNRFLVVYERAFSTTDHDVWGELYSPSTGAAIAGSGVYVDFTGSFWAAPRCANNRIGSQFLVVATRTGAPTEVWGRTREAEDTTQGAQFQVSSGSGDKSSPDVGGDPELTGPTYYCVVWERAFTAGVDHDIHARLVTTSSTLVGGSTILIDNSSSTYDLLPKVSKHDGLAPFGDQAWNIGWNRLFSATDYDVRGAQVRWDGAIQTPSFSIDFSSLSHPNVEVSTSLTPTADGRPYAVVYEEYAATRVEVNARILSRDTLIADQNLSEALGTGAGLNDILPAVETDGNQFAVSWSQQFQVGSGDFDMYAAGMYYAGSTIHVSEFATNLAFSGTYEGNGRITALYGAGFTSTWFGVVWSDFANGFGDIEAATFGVFEGFGPFIGARYCSPAVANSTGVAGRIEAQGGGYAGGYPLHLVANQLPLNVFCYFLASPASASTTTPATSGVVCVGNPLSRFNSAGQVGNTGGTGRVDLDVDTTAIPLPTGGTLALTSGTTFHFQAWYRDGATNNLTDAVAVLFR